jgi:branched-chain amino acid transport system substrate-binding protein
VRRSWTAAIGASAFALLAACGSGDDGNSSGNASGDPIVVGYTGDLSGAFSISGSGALKGIQAYFNQANRDGGIDGRPVKLVTLDDAGDPNKALANVQQLLTQNKVQALLGISVSGLCEAVQDTLEKAEMPIVCTAAGPKQTSGAGASPWVFQAQAGQDSQVGPFIELIKKVAGTDKPKVAYIYYDSASHIGFADNFAPAVEKLGWPIVDKQVVPLVASPPVKQMAEDIAAAKPDVVASLMVDGTAKLFYESLRAAGYEGPIVQNPDTGSHILSDTKDPNVYILTHEYIENTDSDDIGGDENYQKMLDALAADKVDAKTSYVPRGYLNAMVLATALKDCNACTGSELAAAIQASTSPSDGITPGDLSYTPDNHSGAKSMASYYWKDNKIELFMDKLPTSFG